MNESARPPPASEPSDPAALPYRPNVGVMLVNGDGLIFTARRHDLADAWQMPQGGIDAGEDADTAAFRELEEETGVRREQVTLLAESAGRLRYDFPDWLLRRRRERFRGQEQTWFCLRLDAPDTAIDITAHVDPRAGHPEFAEWRWSTGEEVLAAIIDFKRDVYARVLAEFAGFYRER